MEKGPGKRLDVAAFSSGASLVFPGLEIQALVSRRSHPKSKCSVYNLRQETPEISQKSPSNEYHTEHFT